MDILTQITSKVRSHLDQNNDRFVFADNKTLRRSVPQRDFLDSAEFFLIAECKKGSPSKGLIRENYDPAALAKIYEESGAKAISVLTEPDFFWGSIADLEAVRSTVRLPVLRKDFIIDPWQIRESYVMGADIVLLIVACLSDQQLMEFYELIRELGLTALIEVHNEAELERALKISPELIGINNRDLKTFQVSLNTSYTLKPLIPSNVKVMSESGITGPQDVIKLKQHGFFGALVGESILRAPNTRDFVGSLVYG